MSRGFGATWGVGTTDVVSSFVRNPLVFSCHAFGARNGVGGGGFGGFLWVASGNSFYCENTINVVFQSTCSGGSGFGIWKGAQTITTDNTWHSYGAAYDGSSMSNVPSIFYDGGPLTVTTTTAPVGTTPTANSAAVDLGNTVGIRNWDGRIGEIAMWHGVKLSASEFAALARGKPAYLVRPDALIGYFPFSSPHHPALNLAPGSGFNLVSGGSLVCTGTKLHADPPLVAKNRMGINSRSALAQGNFPILTMGGIVSPPAAIFGYTNSPMGSIRRIPNIIGY